jgi:hypothetical protein
MQPPSSASFGPTSRRTFTPCISLHSHGGGSEPCPCPHGLDDGRLIGLEAGRQKVRGETQMQTRRRGCTSSGTSARETLAWSSPRPHPHGCLHGMTVYTVLATACLSCVTRHAPVLRCLDAGTVTARRHGEGAIHSAAAPARTFLMVSAACSTSFISRSRFNQKICTATQVYGLP